MKMADDDDESVMQMADDDGSSVSGSIMQRVQDGDESNTASMTNLHLAQVPKELRKLGKHRASVATKSSAQMGLSAANSMANLGTGGRM